MSEFVRLHLKLIEAIRWLLRAAAQRRRVVPRFYKLFRAIFGCMTDRAKRQQKE